MRLAGPAAGAGGLGRNDHLCWVFDDRASLLHAAVDYLRGGIACGQRLLYVSGRTRDEMLADVAPLLGADELLHSGALLFGSLQDMYVLASNPDPEAQLATYAQVVESALADGFTGLRVFAEVTDLVRDADGLAKQIRLEHLADEFMSGQPFSALCAYDLTAIDADGLADIATVHPLVRVPPEMAPFRLYFADNARLTLAGDIDAFGSIRLERLLTSSHLRDRPHIVLDVADVQFIDGRGLHTLVRFGRELGENGGGGLRIDGASQLLYKVWRALRFDEVPGVELHVTAA